MTDQDDITTCNLPTSQLPWHG